MPFTFAHPAIVIPLKRISRNGFNLTALVIGSMAPDFEYFARMKTQTTISHTTVGIFIFDWPLVIVLSFIFQLVIRKPLLIHLPRPFDRMFKGGLNVLWCINSIKAFLVFIHSAIIGIVSHIIWDSFTHKNGAVVEKLSALNQKANVLGYQIPIYKFLQHGSTLIGLIAIAYFVMTCPKLGCDNMFVETRKRHKIKFWSIVILFALLVTAARIGLTSQVIGIQLVGTFIVTFISGTMIGLLIASITSKAWIES